MSQGTYLVCEATKQAVHVSEVGGAGFSGPDYPVLVGAFCQAHIGRELTVKGESWHIDEYTEWTVSNVERQFSEIAGSELQYLLRKISESLRALGLN